MTIDTGAVATPAFTTSGTAPTTGITTNVSGSSFLIFVCHDAATTGSASDTVGGVATGNVYTAVPSTFGGFSTLDIFLCTNGVGGANHVFIGATAGGGLDVQTYAVELLSADLTAALVDAISSPNWKDDIHNDTTPYTSNAVAANAGDLLLGFISTFTNAGAESLNWGTFAQVVADGNVLHFSGGIGKLLAGSTTSFSLSVTSSGGGTTEAASCIIAFKPAGAGPITVTPNVGAATLQGNAASLGYNLTPQTA